MGWAWFLVRSGSTRPLRAQGSLYPNETRGFAGDPNAPQGSLRDSTAFRVLARRAAPCAAAVHPGRVRRPRTSPPRSLSRRNPMNTVSLIGRLTADPDIRAGEQHESASFRLAVPRPGSDAADFVDIVTFDQVVKVCGEYLTKGRQVAVASPHRNRRFRRGPRKPCVS